MHHVLSTLEVQSDQWIVDYEATCHMCNDKGLFDNFSDLTQAQDVTLGDGHHLKAVGRGSFTLELELSKDRVKNVNYMMFSMYQICHSIF